MDVSADAHVFFHPAIVRAWYETYRDLRRIEPRFLVAERGADERVFFPLVLDRCGWKDAWVQILCPVGSNEFDYHDPIVVTVDATTCGPSFWDALHAQLHRAPQGADCLSLPRVRQSAFADCNSNGFVSADKAPYLDLRDHDSFDDLLCSLHKQLRQELRRQPRRLEKLGPLEMRVHLHQNVESEQFLPIILKTHAARWPDAYRAPGWHRNLLLHGLASGILHVTTLESCAKPISWHVGFLWKHRMYYYLPTFNQQMATYSPGKVHLAMLVQTAFEKNVRCFDFLIGQEPYKARWTSSAQNVLRAQQSLSSRFGTLRLSLQRFLREAVAPTVRSFREWNKQA